MSRAVSPFGDGKASQRIADLLQQHEQAIREYAKRPGNPRALANA
jgi:UDP-N-acetylglucosamine 2-epimerase